MTSRQNSFSNSQIDSGVSDGSASSCDFTLKVSSVSSGSESLRLEISSDEGDANSDYYDSSKKCGMQSSTIQMVDSRPLSPVFQMIKRSRDSSQLIYKKVETYLKKQLFSNSEENCSSSESELELSKFKKIGNQTNKELFSSDSGSILTEEESLMDNSENSVKLDRRITRSEALKRRKLLQKQALEIFKERRSQKIKILMPLVSSACAQSRTHSKESLRQKLRQMKLFRFC